ncbi:hypothetical protein JI664_03585 [Rhodobacter sp. NTK016B]|uniref:hypothetical protein n=1 Tax=Rhodobacter sp. NTK016B TaxID=2759676 RepID=UPI001A8E9191|nr:hypothetical protein [Rhodobacter sp. NTK016B]MBN8291039.1 hypothetical protein [Rhodobacter sp. NTK016B]
MLNMGVDASDFLRRADDMLNRHLPQIEVWAVNWTAQDGLDALKDHMRVTFDRPTRWTLNAFHVWRATKTAPVATVQEKGHVARRHYLKVQSAGGPRPQTALDKLLSERVVSAEILHSVVPAEGARLNAYGNWSPGERNQALSGIGAQRDRAANATDASRARGLRRGRASYFVPRNGGLSPGIWKRTASGDLSKVAHFTKAAPRYDAAFHFEGVVARTYRDRIGINLRRAFERALATAR